MEEQNSKDYKHHDREREFQASTGDGSSRHGANPEPASMNLKKKRKRIPKK